MSYLKFDKNLLINLDQSLTKEMLRTNQAGAYHCTTLVGCNTRKQHGLLVIPIEEMGNRQHVLLSTLDETVIQHGAPFRLSIHRYRGGAISPAGHKYIREFDCEDVPRMTYRVGGVILTKEKNLYQPGKQNSYPLYPCRGPFGNYTAVQSLPCIPRGE